jgi:hexosaminidase
MLGDGAAASGRCYTAAEIGRWVARADRLGVTLIPEVDLPAHVHAALTALPQLADPDDRSSAVSVQHFTNNVLVPGHPLLGDFLERVIDSVAALFPSSPWIHIGGDEVPEGAWEGSPIVAEYRSAHGLRSGREVERAFHRQLATIVRSRTGRALGAWQEAAECGGIRPDDGYVVGWRTPEASRELAAAGFDVVASPSQAYYLDMALDESWTTPGASWVGSVSLDDVCRFVPDAGWSQDERGRLLGLQACLWTEYVADEEILKRQLFPRLDAIAERAWTGRIHGGSSSLRARAADHD